MARRFQSILETVGHMPVVRINRLAPDGVNLYVKVEAFNPLGSVKDRLALGVIEAAEQSGELKPGQTVIEATSGNTGIGLAMVCAAKRLSSCPHDGGDLQCRTAATDALPRRESHSYAGRRARGGDDQEDDRTGRSPWLVHDPAVRERSQPGFSFPHDRARNRRRLRRRPARLLGHRLRHRRHAEGRRPGAETGAPRNRRSSSASRRMRRCSIPGSSRSGWPMARPPRRIRVSSRTPCRAGRLTSFPKITGDAVDMKLIDRILPISGADAIRCSKELAAKEGIFVGITSGGTFAGALKIAARRPKAQTSSACFPTPANAISARPLFADVPADMTEDELRDLALDAERAAWFRISVGDPPRPRRRAVSRRFDRHRGRLAAADAERRDAALEAARAQARRSASPECARPRRRSGGRARRRRR